MAKSIGDLAVFVSPGGDVLLITKLSHDEPALILAELEPAEAVSLAERLVDAADDAINQDRANRRG